MSLSNLSIFVVQISGSSIDSSKWTNNINLYVGYSGNGTLRIEAGGQVSSYLGDLGYYSGSNGTAFVTGMGSKWINDINLKVGYDGNGMLNIGSGSNSGGLVTASTMTLANFSDSTGTCNLNSGTLQAGTISQGTGSAQFNWSDGTIRNYNASTDLSVSSKNNLVLKLAAAGTHAFSIDSGRTGTVDAVLGDATSGGTLAKLGPGLLKLNGANTYTGSTTIAEGTLALGSTGTLASTPIDVQSGAVFDASAKTGGFNLGGTQTLKGSGSVLGAVVATAGSLIEPGESPGVLTINGDLTLNEGARLDFDLDTLAASDKVSMPASTLYLNNQEFGDFTFHPLGGFGVGTYLLIDAGMIQGNLGSNLNGIIGGLSARMSLSGNDLVLTVVPEPGVWALLATACLDLLAFFLRRRRSGNMTTRIG